MLSGTIRSVGDAATDKAAWNKIFTDFNKRRGKGAVGYTKGEKIAVKLNLNQVTRPRQRSQRFLHRAAACRGRCCASSSSRLALRPPTSPSTTPSATFQPPSSTAAPRNFPASTSWTRTGTEGREKAVPDKTKPLVFAKGDLTFYLPTVLTQAAYMINVAGLKGHTMAGMTVTAKNHQGTILTADGSAGARFVHPWLAVKGGNRAADRPLKRWAPTTAWST